MADLTPHEGGSTPGKKPTQMEEVEEEMGTQQAMGDVHGVGIKIQRAEEVYRAYAGLEDKPSKGEVFAWNLYELCSYFIHTVLIPIVFPLIISQTLHTREPDVIGWSNRHDGTYCGPKQLKLYEGLTNRLIKVHNMNFSPLEWTSISWFTGLILAVPILGSISKHFDHGQSQQLISVAAIAIGALFCLPTGFFRTPWVFPPYIAFIVAANTAAAASHTRHFGLMVRGFIGPVLRRSQFSSRREVAGWLSLYGTAAGSLGAAIISAFTYHMLRVKEKFFALWIVLIFSGLKWLVGISHIFVTHRHTSTTNSTQNSTATAHMVSILRYPHAIGGLAGVFLSSFSTMCIFAGGVLFLVGQLCLKPAHFFYLLLTYFLFPLLSLPLLHPLLVLMKTDAVKMQLLGFLLSTATSGLGFYYRNKNWDTLHVLLVAGLQSTSVGLLHAFGRVLLLDCSPPGKEGAFSVWFSWVRAVGTCAGFAIASTIPGKIGSSLGIAFCTSVFGIVILIFGNVSNMGGAIDAGHVRHVGEDGKNGLPPDDSWDTGIGMEGGEHAETLKRGKAEV
ncbi:hypothetical protein L1049_022508 [Liquidambar formosana]|uniref:Uncharacterized protein n=1 Tax=Liquidambar formosana TaxID=63359 RepID=A0AAP0WQ93_LIQFO